MKRFKYESFTNKQKQMFLTSALLVALGFNVSFMGNQSQSKYETAELAERMPSAFISVFDSCKEYSLLDSKTESLNCLLSNEELTKLQISKADTILEQNDKKENKSEVKKNGTVEGKQAVIKTEHGDVPVTYIKQGKDYIAITQAGDCEFCNQHVKISADAENLATAVVEAIKKQTSTKEEVADNDEVKNDNDEVKDNKKDNKKENKLKIETKLEKIANDCEKKYADTEDKDLYSYEDTEVYCNVEGLIKQLDKSKEAPSQVQAMRFLTEKIAPDLVEQILNPTRYGEKESGYKSLQMLESKIPKKNKELRDIVSKIAAEVVRKQAISIKQKLQQSDIINKTNPNNPAATAYSTALLQEVNRDLAALPALNNDLYSAQVFGLKQAIADKLVDVNYASGIMSNYNLFTQDIINGMSGHMKDYLIPQSALRGIPGADSLFANDNIFGQQFNTDYNRSNNWINQNQPQFNQQQFNQPQWVNQPSFNNNFNNTFNRGGTFGRGSITGGTIYQGQQPAGQYQNMPIQQSFGQKPMMQPSTLSGRGTIIRQ